MSSRGTLYDKWSIEELEDDLRREEDYHTSILLEVDVLRAEIALKQYELADKERQLANSNQEITEVKAAINERKNKEGVA